MAPRRNQTDKRRPTRTNNLRRKPATQTPRKLILIVCEGEKTEQQYFDAIRKSKELMSVSIDIIKAAGQNTKLVEHAMIERIRREKDLNKPRYDEVWCVFDREAAHQKDDFIPAIELALRSQFRLAISNPCFEYWYLLHFQKRDRPFYYAKELKHELKQYISDYAEATHVYHKISDRTQQAITHAEQLYEHVQKQGDPYPNPSTTVYRLVRRLLE